MKITVRSGGTEIIYEEPQDACDYPAAVRNEDDEHDLLIDMVRVMCMECQKLEDAQYD